MIGRGRSVTHLGFRLPSFKPGPTRDLRRTTRAVASDVDVPSGLAHVACIQPYDLVMGTLFIGGVLGAVRWIWG
jgi:hypothetical protein